MRGTGLGTAHATTAASFTGTGVTAFTTNGGQVIWDGGTLDIRGVDLNVTNFNDNLNITNSLANASLIFQQNQDGTASGVFSGNMNLVKNGVGTLTLTARTPTSAPPP